MASSKPLLVASFGDATRYFVLQAVIVCTVTIVGIPLLPIIVPIVWIAKTIEYRHISCELHPRSLKIKRGWLNKREQTVPLDKITDLSIHQSLLMRLLSTDGISIETAGQTGMGGALVTLVGMRDARGFRDTVLEQRDGLVETPAIAKPGDAGTEPLAGPAAGEVVVLLREIRDDLRAMRERDTDHA